MKAVKQELKNYLKTKLIEKSNGKLKGLSNK